MASAKQQEELAMSQFGTLLFSIGGAENGVGLSQSNEYYVRVDFPTTLMRRPPKLVTKSCKITELQWTVTAALKFEKHMDPDMRVVFHLMQYGYINDKKVGEGAFTLGETLFTGRPQENRPVRLMSGEGSEKSRVLATVLVSMAWENDSPPNYLLAAFSDADEGGGGGGTTTTTASANAIIKKNLRNEVAELTRLPECEGRDYTVRIRIHKARNLQSEDENTRYDPIVAVKVGSAFSDSTEKVPKTNNPIFDEEFVFTCTKVDKSFWTTPIVFSVLDHHYAMPNTHIGEAQLECGMVYRSNADHFMQHKWLVLRKDITSGSVMGFLQMSVAVLDAQKDPIPDPDDDDEHEDDEESIVMNMVAAPGAQFENIFLHCEIFRAEDLPEMDAFLAPDILGLARAVGDVVTGGAIASGRKSAAELAKEDKHLCDPYVKVRFGARTVVTPTRDNTQYPTWNTAVNLPVALPTLTDSVFVEMWDRDPMRDEIACTKVVSLTKLMALGRAGLPMLSARWLNFYGAPRSTHQSTRFNDYFDRMDRGVVDGADYRGRLLVRFVGTRDKRPASTLLSGVAETVLSVTAIVQTLQFSMLPRGKYKIVASMGNYRAESRVEEGAQMIGEGTKLRSIFFGEELRINGDFSVIIPQDPEVDASVAEQLPDIIVSLMDGDTMYASLRLSAAALYAKPKATYYCQPMRVLMDPAKMREGEEPSEPLAQVYAGLFVRAAKPESDQVVKGSSLSGLFGIDSRSPDRMLLQTCVYQARQLPAGDSNGLSDPFVRVTWANGTSQSGTKLETLNPIYDELLRCIAEAKQPYPDVVVEVWDWNFLGRNTFLGKAIVPFDLAFNPESVNKPHWITGFRNSQGKLLEQCELLLAFEVSRFQGAAQKPPEQKKFLKKVGSKDTYRGFPIPPPLLLPKMMYSIKVDVLSLRRMRRFRMMDIKAPSIEVELAGTCVKVQKVTGANPDFNRSFELVMELPENPLYLPMLNIRVYDNRLGAKSLVGCAVLHIDSKKYSPSEKELVRQQQDEAVAHRLQKLNEFKGVTVGRTRGVAVNPARRRLAGVKAAAQAVMLQARLRKPRRGQMSGGTSGGEDAKDTRGALTDPLLAAPEAGTSNARTPPNTESVEMPESGEEENNQTSDFSDGDGDDVRSSLLQFSAEAPEVDVEPAQRSAREAMQELREVLQQNFISPDDVDLVKEELRAEQRDEEPLWFNRFDPEGFHIDPAKQVSRLGRVKGLLPNGRTTAEDYFGPFDDIGEILPLQRGWGKSNLKAGELYFDMSVVRMGRAGGAGAVPTGPVVEQHRVTSRAPVKFLVRIYVISCNNLTAMDHSILGNKSDPYLVFTLTNDSTNEDVRRVSCKDEKKFQTLNPEFFLVREMQGVLPKHNTLRIAVYDYDRIGFDELIGFSDINLEHRWFSTRGYSHRLQSSLQPGSYTEKRMLRNDLGQLQGSIEMWVDMFSTEYSVIPRPIDITPPPPIDLELRVVVWNTRDVVLQDVSIHGEAMTDIYLRCWLDGMIHDVQTTDVHYRSLDGTGNFNWRMIFPIIFEPRTRKIMPANSTSTEKGFFHIRREQKKYAPILKVQLYDNDLFPGTDDFIGEVNLNLLRLKPVSNRRNLERLLEAIRKDVEELVCFFCCRKHKSPEEMTLEERQQLAKKEFDDDVAQERRKWERDATNRVDALRLTGDYTEDQLGAFKKEFVREYQRQSVVNLFAKYVPHSTPAEVMGGAGTRKQRRQPAGYDEKDLQRSHEAALSSSVAADEAPIAAAANAAGPAAGTSAGGGGGSSDVAASVAALLRGGSAGSGGGAPSRRFAIPVDDNCPATVETPKYWFTCRGPKGGGRVGDVQLSFQLVRSDVMAQEKKLQAGKGRSEPNALPEPKRPDSSFFWLSSPFKAAVHILWKNYKWYFLTLICIVASALFVYVFLSNGVQIKSSEFFGDNSPPAGPPINVIIPTPQPTTP